LIEGVSAVSPEFLAATLVIVAPPGAGVALGARLAFPQQ
jgi:hypothetical protein